MCPSNRVELVAINAVNHYRDCYRDLVCHFVCCCSVADGMAPIPPLQTGAQAEPLQPEVVAGASAGGLQFNIQ